LANNFLTANISGLESMQPNDQAYGYQVNRIAAVLNGVNPIPLIIGSLTIQNGLIVSAAGAAITGNSTVTGNLNVTGTLTPGGTVIGPITINPGPLTVSTGDITASAGPFNTNGSTAGFNFADRSGGPPGTWVLYANGGLARLWNTVNNDQIQIGTTGNTTWPTGSITLTAGNLIFAAASAKIIPGATSLLFPNNANNATNLSITDAGLLTTRNALSIPPSAGGTVATTSYGSVPVKINEVTPSSTGTVTFSSIPGVFRNLRLEYTARSDLSAAEQMNLRFNGDSGANYAAVRATVTGTNTTLWQGGTSQTQIAGYYIPGPGVAANYAGQGTIFISNYSGAVFYKAALIFWSYQDQGIEITKGTWTNTGAITSITITIAGNFVTGSLFTLYGIP
jgi:hypothetical protein